MKTIKILLLIAGLFFISGCFKPKVERKKVVIPSWYLNPPTNTDTTLYGLGEGIDKKTAVDAGLNALASKLSVSIESDLINNRKISKSVGGESYSQEIISNVKSSVEKITFNNYKVEKLQEINGQMAAVVSVNKQGLFQRKNSEYKKIKRELNDTLFQLKTQDPIKVIQNYKPFKKKIDKGQKLTYLLKTLNNTFPLERELKTLESIERRYKQNNKNLLFRIQNDQSSKNLAQSIAVALNNEGYKVINHDIRGKKIITVDLRSREGKNQLMGYKIIKSDLDINLLYKKNTVGGNHLGLIGKSTINFAQAKEKVKKNLDDEIKKRGILQTLGINN